jgi:glycosyltransferase involved in cell wall biosynthesis
MIKDKILHVTAYYPPHLGGQEIAVQDLANQLRSAGREVDVVTSDLGGEKGVRVEEGIRVSRLKSNEFSHAALIWGLPYWLIRNTSKYTVVHLHAGQAFTPEVVWLASKLIGFKYIIHLHADFTASSATGRVLPLYKKIFLNRAIRGASATVVLSSKQRQEVCSANPKVKNVQVISNGITSDFFHVPRKRLDTPPRLLFVGRLSPHKNVAGLLEALATIDTTLGLDIIGDGECREQLEKLANVKKLSGVKFHGRLPRDSIKHFYSTSSAFILPSTVEPQGIVLLEAMACRIPIIVSLASGLADTVKGSGILVEPTVDGIASGIKEFLSMSPGDTEIMVNSASRKAQELSWSSLLATYVNLYEGATKS